MVKIIALQHAECEGLGSIGDVLGASNIEVRMVRGDLGEAIPQHLGDASGLIVMGGPTGVYEYERYPFLADEIRLIQSAVNTDTPVLGICLGSQLLAAALGAKVYKGPRKEIGWHRVYLDKAAADDPLFKDVPEQYEGFHWHGDIFDLPEGAVKLAHTDLTALQAFRYRNATGILFHMEVTEASIAGMIEAFPDEFAEGGASVEAVAEQGSRLLTPLRAIGEEVFRRWAAMVEKRGG
jgi:GMP synthase (glutamine-hydrolysing)